MQWHERDLMVEALEDQYPDIDVEEISLSDLYELILELHDFSDDPESANDSMLKKILEDWADRRAEN